MPEHWPRDDQLVALADAIVADSQSASVRSRLKTQLASLSISFDQRQGSRSFEETLLDIIQDLAGQDGGIDRFVALLPTDRPKIRAAVDELSRTRTSAADPQRRATATYKGTVQPHTPAVLPTNDDDIIAEYLRALRVPPPLRFTQERSAIMRGSDPSAPRTSLDDLLCAQDHELVLLQGPSGIGKSTALELFASRVADAWLRSRPETNAAISAPYDLLSHPQLGYPVPVLIAGTDECANMAELLNAVGRAIFGSDRSITVRGRYLLLLIDNVDRLSQSRLRNLVGTLQTLLRSPPGDGPARCRIVVASKSYSGSLISQVVQLSYLTDAEAAAWLTAAEIPSTKQRDIVACARGDALLLTLAVEWANDPVQGLDDAGLWENYLKARIATAQDREALEMLALETIRTGTEFGVERATTCLINLREYRAVDARIWGRQELRELCKRSPLEIKEGGIVLA